MIDFNNDIEPSKPIVPQNDSPQKTPFIGFNRQLTDEDYASSGVQKLIVNRIDELWEENVGHKQKIVNLEKSIMDILEKYYNTNTELAIYKEKFKKQSFWEIFETISLMVGSVLIGLVTSSHLGYEFGIPALILIVLSLIGKLILNNDTVKKEDK